MRKKNDDDQDDNGLAAHFFFLQAKMIESNWYVNGIELSPRPKKYIQVESVFNCVHIYEVITLPLLFKFYHECSKVFFKNCPNRIFT